MEDDLASIQQGHFLAAAAQVRDDVGGEQNRPVAPKARHHLPKAHAFFRVQTHRRLVHDQHLRFVNQRLRHAQPPNHAAGELLHLAMRYLGKAHLFEGLGHALLPLALVGEAGKTRQRIQHFFGTMLPPSAELLGQVADQAAHLAPVFGDIVAANRHRSTAGHQQRANYAHERALASAVRPQQTEQPGAKLEIHPVKSDMAALVGVPQPFGLNGEIASHGSLR